MSRKDYVAIAGIVRDHYEQIDRAWPDSGLRVDLASRLGDLFAQDNPAFDRGRFYAACGIKGGSDE